MNITLTGIDEKTSILKVKSLCEEYPSLEWGILYTRTPEGRLRYPSRDWIMGAAEELQGRCALHICGRGAREELLDCKMDDLAHHFARVQINGRIDAAQLSDACVILSGKVVITQWSSQSNAEVLHAPISNHAVLVDGSGGRGILPKRWTRPITSKPVGFAGGLGPGNVTEEVRRMGALAKMPGAWIDMEGKLRDSADHFSVGRAEAVLRQLLPL